MIWNKLQKPFFVLAPMANVTDSPFRRVVAAAGRPDVFYTEFVAADGLCSPGREILMKDLMYTQEEKPIIAQFFGSRPDNIERCANLAGELGFDGVDINMGCPDRTVEKQGAGAALIKNPKLAKEIIRSARKGAGDLPLSVKTRLGYNSVDMDWIKNIIEEEPDVLIIHARTRKDMSLVPARWEEVYKIVELIKGSEIKIIGNGDIESIDQGKKLAQEVGLDGLMVGRGIFKNPWLFSGESMETKNKDERLALLKYHLSLFEEFWGADRHYDTMKRFFKIYISDWPGAKELRVSLMETKNINEAKDILNS